MRKLELQALSKFKTLTKLTQTLNPTDFKTFRVWRTIVIARNEATALT